MVKSCMGYNTGSLISPEHESTVLSIEAFDNTFWDGKLHMSGGREHTLLDIKRILWCEVEKS